MQIKITWDQQEITATLKSTPTAKKLWAALPVEAEAQTWGDEVYFDVPVQAPLEKDARQVVEPGTVCFWVEGSALALPFGPTPISEGDECRLVTKVNVVGQIDGDPKQLRSIKPGVFIAVQQAHG